MKAVLFIALLIGLLSVPSCSTAQGGIPFREIPPSGISNDDVGGFPFIEPYQPLAIKSLNQIPTRIRVKVQQHLLNRLGGDFSGHLTFQDGEIINHHQLYRDNPDAKNYLWAVPTYILNFGFSDQAKGVAKYCAQIWLSSSGKVVQEVNLPDMHTHSFSSLLSVADAARLAIKAGFDPSKMLTNLRYDRGAVVWDFEVIVAVSHSGMKMHGICVDAYTGKVVEDYFSNIISN